MNARTHEDALLRAMPLVFVLIWSTGFIVARYGMPYAPPMKFLVVRYALSILCFLPWILLARVAWPRNAAQWLHLAVVGVLIHAGYLGGVWSAVKAGMGSGLSALIVGLQPVLTAIWLSSTGSQVTRRQWLGLGLGFVGLAMVVARKFGQGGEVGWLNLLFALLALLSITIGTLYQKRFVTPCDVRSANTVQLIAALLVSLPLTLLESEPMQWNVQLVAAMAWSVLALTLGGSSLLYLLIQRGAATKVTSLLYLVPPTTALMAWVLFSESITLVTLLGTAITVFGVSLVVRTPSLQPDASAMNPEINLFPGFSFDRVTRDGVTLHTRRAGQGPALLLLHGHPQSQVMWHRVASTLMQHFTVVMMDLRGYGDSDRPLADADHTAYSKREMALDAMAVMRHHGFDRFQVLAHDRGARVAHRLALDHVQAVERLMLLDIAPTLAMYENTTEAFAKAYWHWFFLIQPSPLPEALIESDPVRYIRSVMGRRHAGLAAFAPQAMAEYERCVQIPGTAHGLCEDYRASATIDLVHDRAEVQAGIKLEQPLRVLWGDHGAVGQCFDVMALWQARAVQVTGQGLPCGHYIAEEAPEALLAEVLNFFRRES